MVPRAGIVGLLDTSPAIDKLKPGDAILAVDAGTDHLKNPTLQADSRHAFGRGAIKI